MNSNLDILKEKGLKVTPQRLAVLQAVMELGNHPTADQIIVHVRELHPGIASGTVYKVLETFVQNNIIKKVKTEKDLMRYDGIIGHHHHLYSTENDKIEDYYDADLDKMLKDYFDNKNIEGFKIEDIKLQIKGKFN